VAVSCSPTYINIHNLLIPICDIHKSLIAFIGRLLQEITLLGPKPEQCYLSAWSRYVCNFTIHWQHECSKRQRQQQHTHTLTYTDGSLKDGLIYKNKQTIHESRCTDRTDVDSLCRTICSLCSFDVVSEIRTVSLPRERYPLLCR